MKNNEWQESKQRDFWAEIAPCEHVLQIYEDSGCFLDTLAGFVGDGINSGDSTIVIATSTHLNALEMRLLDHGINVQSLKREDQFIPLNAEEALSIFMRNGWPDSSLFFDMVSKLLKRARKKNRNVRAFGEMVAILWEQGNNGATVHLEHLWNEFCSHEDLTLFCAYPKSGFTANADQSIKDICAAHSKVISGKSGQQTLLFKKA